MDIRDVLALNLRKQRRAKGLSQEELAHRADIDRTYISSLERSLYAAGIDVVDRLARALETEAADLLRRPTAGSDSQKKSKGAPGRKARKSASSKGT
jgi:transcriptional regulator with XRE-family HTH domain